VTDQLSMFDPVPPRFPRVRRSDARSSHEAAALVEKTGIAKRQAEEVLAALRRFPMSTSFELARASGLDRYAVGRRLPELAAPDVHLVERIAPTKESLPCAVSGKRVVRWRPV
jgi:hypothetical protein